jgi:outer membrane lipoprotein carrier protein
MRKFFFLILWFALAAQANQAAKEVNDLLSNIQTLRADYVQTNSDPRFRKDEVLTGSVILQRPRQFRWQVLTPYKQLLVADGERLWIYDEDLEQVTVQSLDVSLADAPALLLAGQHEDVAKHFVVTAVPQEYTVQTYELRPLAEDSLLQVVYLSFQGTIIKGMRMIDNLDQVIDINFMQVSINDPLPQDLFRFVPPAGVDVIGGEYDDAN